MANSPAHRFGQMVGDLLEEIMVAELQEFCSQRGLFLDKKGVRGKARQGKKVTWEDRFGNVHDLDFVIEKGGSEDCKGRPLAFIEAAWRRYTKHSRNKAQEIQGALLPIAERHFWDKPFLGAVLAGVFTSGSLTQMRSSGFEVILFPYDTIVAAFRSIGIDAAFDETTPDTVFEATVARIEDLGQKQRNALKMHLIKNNQKVLQCFLDQLSASLDRKVQQILVVPLHGSETPFTSLSKARQFVEGYEENKPQAGVFRKFEIIVKYSNDDRIEASFNNKAGVLDFLDYIDQHKN